jgi:hypothetical protein
MISIVLAGVLGAVVTLVVLLFQRQRELCREITQIRAERDSEWMLHAIACSTNRPPGGAAAVNGPGPPQARSRPRLRLLAGR